MKMETQLTTIHKMEEIIMAENKKILTVTQQVKELVYDIQNKAYLSWI